MEVEDVHDFAKPSCYYRGCRWFSVLEKLIGALVNAVEPQALLLSLMLLEKPLQVVSRRSNS